MLWIARRWQEQRGTSCCRMAAIVLVSTTMATVLPATGNAAESTTRLRNPSRRSFLGRIPRIAAAAAALALPRQTGCGDGTPTNKAGSHSGTTRVLPAPFGPHPEHLGAPIIAKGDARLPLFHHNTAADESHTGSPYETPQQTLVAALELLRSTGAAFFGDSSDHRSGLLPLAGFVRVVTVNFAAGTPAGLLPAVPKQITVGHLLEAHAVAAIEALVPPNGREVKSRAYFAGYGAPHAEVGIIANIWINHPRLVRQKTAASAHVSEAAALAAVLNGPLIDVVRALATGALNATSDNIGGTIPWHALPSGDPVVTNGSALRAWHATLETLLASSTTETATRAAAEALLRIETPDWIIAAPKLRVIQTLQ